MNYVDKRKLKAAIYETNCKNAGRLLLEIRYWMNRTTDSRGVYNSYRDWAALTGLSFKQTERAIILLRKMGLIATHVCKHAGNPRTLFIRALTPKPGPSTQGVTWGDPQGDTGGDLLGQKNSEEDQKKSKTEEAKPSASQSASQGSAEEAEEKNMVKKTKAEVDAMFAEEESSAEESVPAKAPGKLSKSAQETLAALNEVKATNTPPPPWMGTVGSMEKIWRYYMAREYGGYVRKWTQKERGQAQHFARVCKDAGLSVPDALKSVVTKWPEFTVTAKLDKGAFNAPSKPDLSFLLKFSEAAVNWVQPADKPENDPSEEIASFGWKPGGASGSKG